MRRHETPTAVASALARYAPRRMERILDPAVGNGVLLEPFLQRAAHSDIEMFAVDTDSRPLKTVRHKFGACLGKRLNIVNADFLKWVCDFLEQNNQKLFDCIAMNSPFAARRNAWKSLKRINALYASDALPQVGPVEAGFILGAIALLRPGGRLLAILPASLVSSPCLAWVRELMVEHGTILHVHELPRFTFPKIESRIYLIVFEKGKRGKKTQLLNHDLIEPEKMLIETSEAVAAQRLDFRYHSSTAKMVSLKGNRSFGWQSLSELATVWRGTEHTPGISRHVVHSGNYRNGFWHGDGLPNSRMFSASDRRILSGDVLVKRVSRNCSQSFGLAYGILGAPVSDCVLVIRPRAVNSSIRLLFAIRCLMALDFGPALLEKGTGASYLSQNELRNFKLPYALSEVFGPCFRLYIGAVQQRFFSSMKLIEKAVSDQLIR